MYRKNVASQFVCFQGVDSATGGIKSGVTWTVRRCIDGTFAAGGGTVTEDSTNGWYKYAMSQADTNGNDISFNFTGTGAIPQTVNIITTACDPTSTAFGLSIAKTTNITGFNDITAAQAATGVWQDTTAGDFTTALSVGKSVMNGVSLGTGLTVNDITTKTGFALTAAYDAAKTASQAGDAMTLTAAYNAAKTASQAGDAMTLTAAYDSAKTAITTAAQAESYRANGATGTVPQLLYEIAAHLGESAISGTTKTINKLDHVTAAETFTLDSATTPASITRAT